MKINRQRLWIMAWFTFTRRERNGIFMLSLILLLLQSVLLYRYFIHPDLKPVRLSREEVAQTRSFSNTKSPESYARKGFQSKKPLPEITSFVDPNTFSSEEWIRQGLSPGQANVVVKWQLRGGVFRKEEDLARMKFIPARVYENLKPWLKFEIAADAPLKKDMPLITDPPLKKRMDLNTADTVLLCELPLIGPGRARTIWRFRERLGGFYSLDQLREIKSLPDSVIEVILPKVQISTPVYRKIDVNSVSDTIYHPYFSRPLLKMIVAYRIQNGLYTESTQLQKLPLVNEDLWRKIVPYIFLSKPPQIP
jgi:DNA uptake protein ComE-like DNA-binding protein